MSENKILIFSMIFTLFLILPSVNADLGTFKNGDCMSIITSLNSSYINISILANPSSHIFLRNVGMEKSGSGFNYTFCNTTENGKYTYGYCDDTTACFSNEFYVNPNGSEFTTAQGLIFIIILIVFLLLLIGGINGMSKSMNNAWTIFYICLSYLSLFIIFLVCWNYSYNYLWQTQILVSIFWILWMIMGFGFMPFIIIVSLYIVHKGIKDNLEKEFISQGYTKEEAHEMSKRRKR